MGHNYQKNNVNIEKSVMSGNFIEFPIEWRKPQCSKFVWLEKISNSKLLLQVENGEETSFWKLSKTPIMVVLWRTASS